MATILDKKGQIYEILSDFRTAREYYLKSLNLVEKINTYDSNINGLCYSRLGNIDHIIGEYTSADDYFEKAKNILEQRKNGAEKGFYCYYMGEYKDTLGLY